MSFPSDPVGPNGSGGPNGPAGPAGSPPPGQPQQPWGAQVVGNPFGDQTAGGQPPGAYPFPPPGYPPPPTATDPALRMLAPINVSPWAIASGYLGLLTPLCGVTGPFALLTGILALRQIKKNPQMGGHVRAWFGIVLGLLGSVILVFFLIGSIASFARR